MKNLFKAGIIAFAFGLMFISVDTVNAQYRGDRREARREYREDIRDARRDYRRDIRRGENRWEARREYRDERRDARRDYRRDTGRRVNRGYYYGNRRVYSPATRIIYRNGRRYIVRY